MLFDIIYSQINEDVNGELIVEYDLANSQLRMVTFVEISSLLGEKQESAL